MNSTVRVNVWVMPGIPAYFKWGEVFPNEGSGLGSGFRGTDKDVRDVKGMHGLGRSFGTREVSNDLNDVRIGLAGVRQGSLGVGVILWLATFS